MHFIRTHNAIKAVIKLKLMETELSNYGNVIMLITP